MASTVFTGGSRFKILSMGSPSFLTQDSANEMVYAVNKKYNKRHNDSFLPEKRRKKTKALPMSFWERQRLCCCLWRDVIYSSSS